MSNPRHTCPQMEAVFKDEESHLMCGHAFDEIVYAERFKRWHASNDHNGTTIFFCPFCGMKLDEPRQSQQNEG